MTIYNEALSQYIIDRLFFVLPAIALLQNTNTIACLHQQQRVNIYLRVAGFKSTLSVICVCVCVRVRACMHACVTLGSAISIHETWMALLRVTSRRICHTRFKR